MRIRNAGPRGIGIVVVAVAAFGPARRLRPEPAAARGAAAPAVTVAKPVKKMVTDHDEYVGRFVAVDSVEVRARVSGYLDAIHFKDGQLVKQGDLLFTIDRRPFQTALDQAKANLAAGQANLAYRRERPRRAASSWCATRPSPSRPSTSARRPSASPRPIGRGAGGGGAPGRARPRLHRAARADVAAASATAACRPATSSPAAPAAPPTLLATIVSIDPIRFEFTIDEASYLRYERLAGAAAADVADATAASPVTLKLIDEKDFAHEGQMDFVDNVIDRASGTIRGRAEFANPDGAVHARHVRPHPGAGRRARRGAAGARRRDRHRAGAQVRLRGRRRQRRPSRNTSRSASSIDGLRVIKAGLDAGRPRHRQRPDARSRPAMKVTPQEQGAGAAGPAARRRRPAN